MKLKRMKIILIRGTMNSGKTTTSGLVYSELVKISEKEHTFNGKIVTENSLQFNKKNEVIDFTSVLIIGKLKVGIISAGDIAADLKCNIEVMISLDVDILICCARSRNQEGSSYRIILDDFSEEHEILAEFWIEFSNDYEQKDSVKQTTVKKIIDLIKAI